jgi:glycerol 3-phosphatase-2
VLAGGWRWAGRLGAGRATWAHVSGGPAGVVVAGAGSDRVGVERAGAEESVEEDPEPPHPAKARQAPRTSRRRTAGEDNAGVELADAVRPYDLVLLDLDGCVWVGDEPTRDAPAAIDALRRADKQIAFVTNDPARSPEDYVRKLWRLGIRAAAREVVTVGGAVQFALAERYPEGATATVIGAPALHRHVHDAGLRIVNGTDLAARADVVVIAGHAGLAFDELREATQAALRGADLLAAGRDRTFPMPDGPWPGTGAVVAAIEYASGREAESVGKPEPLLFRTALDRFGGGTPLVVGDRLDADVAGARAAGMPVALVLTGATTREEALAARDGLVAVAEDLAALVLG